MFQLYIHENLVRIQSLVHKKVYANADADAIEIHTKINMFVCLCWGFTAQSTQWDHVERGQFT